jgi:hypothetical protein
MSYHFLLPSDAVTYPPPVYVPNLDGNIIQVQE